MTATLHNIALATGTRTDTPGADSGADAAASARECAPAARASRPAQPTEDLDAAVRTIVRMARLNAIKEVGASDDRMQRAMARQGEILLLAGLRCMAEGGQ